MNTSSTGTHSSAHRQRGAASVAIAMLLMFILVAAVTGVLNMSGSSVIDAAKNEEQVAALFLAESGLERAQGMLKSASDPAVSTACTGITGSGFSVGRGTFNLSATATCDTSVPPVCTNCTITSTGTIGSSSRTVVREVSVAGSSGGASGCGGGGVTPVICPSGITPPPPASDKYPNIVQAIVVDPPPAVLLSNMAYLRHPSGGANNINAAATCVQIAPTDLGCLTQWHDESNTSAGAGVVGSRGASAVVTTAMGPGTYTLTQNLTADSLFAAVGAKFGAAGTLGIVGSFWSDSGATGVTARNNSTAAGSTNNGAACATDIGDATCPNKTTAPLAIPDPPSAGSAQTSRSWCYDADTLVFGFSGKSSNNNSGALTGFSLNGTPSLLPTGSATASYPKPVAGTDSQLYSALRYIFNPYYLSASDAVSGAVVTGSAGATFTGTLTGGTNTMTIAVGGVTAGRLSVGDTISGSSRLGGPGNTSTITAAPAAGLDGTYTLLHDSSGGSTTASLSATSSKLYVTSVSSTLPGLGNLAVADTIFGTGVTANTTIAAIDAGSGGVGTYTLSAAQRFSPTTITSNGLTVTTSSSITAAPTPGTYVAARWTGSGTGLLAAGTTVAASPFPTAVSFKLSARPTTPLSNAEVCGGICALFNHASASASTDFTIGITGTSQWAAGMTCLKGVNKDDIVALTGTGATVKATNWYEPVK